MTMVASALQPVQHDNELRLGSARATLPKKRSRVARTMSENGWHCENQLSAKTRISVTVL